MVEVERQGLNRGAMLSGAWSRSEQVATSLRVEEGEEVVARRKVMMIDDVPVRIALSYFPADLFSSSTRA